MEKIVSSEKMPSKNLKFEYFDLWFKFFYSVIPKIEFIILQFKLCLMNTMFSNKLKTMNLVKVIALLLLFNNLYLKFRLN